MSDRGNLARALAYLQEARRIFYRFGPPMTTREHLEDVEQFLHEMGCDCERKWPNQTNHDPECPWKSEEVQP